MRFDTLSFLTWVHLAGLGLADTIATCLPAEAATCSCPASAVKRYQARAYTFPEHLFPRVADSCSGGTPPCCLEKGPGPLQVSDSTSKTNLQCGAKPTPQDVTNGVVYTIEDCPATGQYAGQKCLHVAITPAAGVTVNDIHLQVDDNPITLNTKLGTWAFNKYCTTAPSECWVPVDAIKETFGSSPPPSLCGKDIFVAAGISISIPGSTSGATCFNQGTTIGSGNWFMYYKLTFECPEICLKQCCCPSTQPPSTKICDIGTAFGYAVGAKNLNGDPVGPAVCDNANRWGWYFATSQTTLSGTLIVGAGQNDLTKGTTVGTWSATLAGSDITFHYDLYDDDTHGHFDLSSVHVYASCTAPTTCAPGQFTFKDDTLSGNSDTSYSKTFAVADTVGGTCSTYYLIFHATVNQQIPSTETCPPKAN